MSTTSAARMALLMALCFSVSVAARAAESEEPGFKPIFNGQDLSGWEGNPQFWSVKDGAIVGQTTAENPTKGNTFLIWRAGTLDDFELRLSYRIVGGNSGIQYRSKDLGNWVAGGYQGDFEAGDTYSGILYEEKGRGILAQRGEQVVIDAEGKKTATRVADTKELQANIKKEDWNEYTIVAEGNHLVHMINGRVTAEVTDKQPGKQAFSGILALQLHAGPPMTVQFKNIRLKRLKLADNRKKIVLVAGTPSHGPGDHEFNAGSLVLHKCLEKAPGVVSAVYLNGWPKDPTAFDNANSILLYMDGGGGHPLIREKQRLEEIGALMEKGVGLCCAHYAVEIPKDKGGPELLKWIGGYYETGYSINPHWVAKFETLPNHPVARGVKPFSIRDEWYYNIRFREGMSGIDPILISTPPDESRRTAAAKEHPGRPEILAWATQRPDGGRGFGFTGGHNHINWGDSYFRTLILNALVWTAGGDVPAEGIVSTLEPEELKQNLDPKVKK